jgi:hypothetical protein
LSGQRFTHKNLEVALSGAVIFDGQETGKSEDPFLVGNNGYVSVCTCSSYFSTDTIVAKV